MAQPQPKVYRYGRDVNTDLILPARYMMFNEPEDLARHCMEDLDSDFLPTVRYGDVVVGEENFGSGSSREHAPMALKASGIVAVIASSFARIFFRNAINIGLPVLELPQAVADFRHGDTISLDVEQGIVKNTRSGNTFQATPYPQEIMDIIRAGGLMNLIKQQRATAS